MLASIGVEYVVLGHSERRLIFGETDADLSMKVDLAVHHGLIPLFCCGESAAERKKQNHFKVVENQLANGLFHLKREAFNECIIAYEPVWAIGTGVNATPEQAQEMHAFIRLLITGKYGKETADSASILYGGSVTSVNAESIFTCPDVDGGLVGGASLKAA
jgi:triosephosphate isomerase